jgi:peptide-methionine (S)-S-oxide reductase
LCTPFLKSLTMKKLAGSILISITSLFACKQKPPVHPNLLIDNSTFMNNASSPVKTETATFANGCFWCTEAIFEELNGVISATSGYTGGHTENPTYKQVCGGETGHAEALQIVYDPSKISFDELLEVFWKTHDPTTLNRQGADVGTQYRSGIFYHNEEQKQKAEQYKADLDKSGAFNKSIVTEITPFSQFYPAEDYHQQYFENNENSNPYCRIVIQPKLEKFRKVFKERLRVKD